MAKGELRMPGERQMKAFVLRMKGPGRKWSILGDKAKWEERKRFLSQIRKGASL